MSEDTTKTQSGQSSGSAATATATKPAAKSKPAARKRPAAKPKDPPVPGAPGEPDGSEHRATVDEQRDEQLKAGKVTGEAAKAAKTMADATPVEQRAGRLGAKLAGGRIDNMSRRDDNDVLMGHFCLIDYADEEFGKEATKAVESVVGEGNAHLGAADYGVFSSAGALDEDGYPLTAVVLLRDEHGGAQVVVPYGALRPALAGRR